MTSDDFIPLTTPANSSTDSTGPTDQTKTATPPSSLTDSLTERLKMARLTMEGPERAIARERTEKEDRIHEQAKKLEADLALVLKHKEDLELAWVVLDTKRNDLKKVLAPILAEEEKMEVKEDELEGRERTTMLPSERQKIEKDRWQAQETRRNIEVKKWELEDKVAFLETQITDNTNKYQTLLDQEESLRSQLDNLDEELNILAEQIKLEAEDKKRRSSIEAEQHQKDFLSREKEIEDKKLDQEKIDKSKMEHSSIANTAPKEPAPKTRDDLLREAEINRHKMQEEIARITGGFTDKTQTSAPKTIIETPIEKNILEPKAPEKTTGPVKKELPIDLKVTNPIVEPIKAESPQTAPTPITINVIKKGSDATGTPTPDAAKSELTATPIEIKTIEIPKTNTNNYREEVSNADLIRKDTEVLGGGTQPIVLSENDTKESKLPKIRTLQGDLANMKNNSTN